MKIFLFMNIEHVLLYDTSKLVPGVARAMVDAI